MNKNILIGGAVVAVALIGAFIFFISSGDTENANNNTSSTQTTQTQQPATTTDTTEQANIASLLTENKNRECTFSYDASGTKVTGTGYFAGGEKMRMNYTSVSDSKTTSGSMIIKSDQQQIWDNDSKKGFTFAFSADKVSETANQGLDLKKEYAFVCKDWTVDESVFTAPTDVTFTSLEDLKIPTQP